MPTRHSLQDSTRDAEPDLPSSLEALELRTIKIRQPRQPTEQQIQSLCNVIEIYCKFQARKFAADDLLEKVHRPSELESIQSQLWEITAMMEGDIGRLKPEVGSTSGAACFMDSVQRMLVSLRGAIIAWEGANCDYIIVS